VEDDVPAGSAAAPVDTLDLIYRMWLAWNWARTGQLTVVLFSVGLVIALVLGGLALVAPPVGAASVFSAACGLLGGGGAHWLVNRRRRTRTRPPRRTPPGRD